MNASVLSSLLPVVLLIAVGLVAARAQWIRPEATKDLSNLVFLVLTPALLFRTMSTVRVQQLELAPVAVYFVSAALRFAMVWGFGGRDRRATVLALASTYSNLVMVGIPLEGLAFGRITVLPQRWPACRGNVRWLRLHTNMIAYLPDIGAVRDERNQAHLPTAQRA